MDKMQINCTRSAPSKQFPESLGIAREIGKNILNNFEE